MTKKTFIALADLVCELKPVAPATQSFQDGRMTQWQNTRDALADFCQSQNPRFDRARWLAYIAGDCGPNGGQKGGKQKQT